MNLVYLNTYQRDGHTHYSGIWYQNPPYQSSKTHHSISGTTLQKLIYDYLDDGFTIRSISPFVENGAIRYAVIWEKS